MLKKTYDSLMLGFDTMMEDLNANNIELAKALVGDLREIVQKTDLHSGDQLHNDTWVVLVLSPEDVSEEIRYSDADMRFVAERIGDSDAVMEDYWVAISCAKDEIAEWEKPNAE